MGSRFPDELYIGKRCISAKAPVYIIAEAGVNHGGDLALARTMIEVAANCGADAVKFQAFRTGSLILENVAKAPYQQERTSGAESQAEMLRKLELPRTAYAELKRHCVQHNVHFLITPFDQTSLAELDELQIDAFKVASTDTTNIPFLREIAARGRPIILSTGMSYLEEVDQAVKAIASINTQLILLQCTANYPIRDEEAHLRVVETYRQRYGCLVGYSDHTVGKGAALYAVPMGAVVVEKHFTLDKFSDGPDHVASLSPEELREFVADIRRIERYLGCSRKEPTESELKTRASLQKNLVAARAIRKGESFVPADLIAKRTGGAGISPLWFDKLIGRFAGRDYQPDEIIDEKL